MITSKELREGITAILKENFPDYKIYFTNNGNANENYFYVEMTFKKKTVDRVYYDRVIGVELVLVLMPYARGRVSRSAMQNAADMLDGAILPCVYVGDRAITVLETRSRIVDETLHYFFDLDFTDFMPEKEMDIGEELDFRLSFFGSSKDYLTEGE